jgi:hypothetical protein
MRTEIILMRAYAKQNCLAGYDWQNVKSGGSAFGGKYLKKLFLDIIAILKYDHLIIYIVE